VSQADDRSIAILRNLPHARLPATYEAAKIALANCAKIDECKDWADKMAALASYGRQADDKVLENHAKRVRARAIERESELLRELSTQPSGGTRTGTDQNGQSGGVMQVGREAGLSRKNTITALQVGNVPKDEFEAAVESDDPPTITELARRGTQSKPKPLVDLGDRTPEEFAAATELIGALEELERYSVTADLDLAVAGLNARERAELIETADALFDWLNKAWEALNADDAQ
jgi:hypothetical protein